MKNEIVEKNPLDVIKDIKRYAKDGTSVDDMTLKWMKWYGLYPHSKRSNDEKKSFYMLRVKIVNGRLNKKQLKVLWKISSSFAQNSADITVRQDIQFHFIKLKNLPKIFKMLESVNLTTKMASGDCARNIVSCPLSAEIEDEVADTTDIHKKLNNYFAKNEEFLTLPRKFKIGICGCKNECVTCEIQDLSFKAKEIEGKIFYLVSVGGGLGSNKAFAKELGLIEKKNILKVAKEIAKLYNSCGNRKNRAKARVGHMIDVMGFEEFKKRLENSLGFEFIKSKQSKSVPYLKRDHFGKIKSVKKGFLHIGFSTDAGVINASGLKSILKAMKKYDVKKIALSTSQNFIALNVPKKSCDNFIKEMKKSSFYARVSSFRVKNKACTGAKYCKFAISETKDLQKRVTKYLDEKFPNFQKVSLSFNGCKNSCAHAHIAQLGFVGVRVKKDQKSVEGFSLYVGAKMDEKNKSFAIKTNIKVPADEVEFLIESIFNDYLSKKSGYNDFNDYLISTYGASCMHEYFNRQIQLWGEKTQDQLQNKKIAIIGCGGLGSSLGIALGASGIGEVHLVDFDEVSIHNIHRQIAFKVEDENRPKAEVLAKLLKDRCPYVKAFAYNCDFDEFKKKGISVDLIIDATDNLPSRKKIDDYAKEVKTPWIYGSVEAFNAQVCFFEKSGFESFKITDKKPAGIAAPIVMHTASLQANLALRYLCGLSVKKDLLYYLNFNDEGELVTQKFEMPKS